MYNNKTYSSLGWVLLLAAPLLLLATSCRSDKGPVHKLPPHIFAPDSIELGDTVNTEMVYMMERAVVLERAKTVYELVKAFYRTQGGVADNDLLDKAYCSKSWNDLLMAVRGKEGATGTLFYDLNHWSMTLDGGKIVTYDDFQVTRLVLTPDKRKATVTFTVYEADTYTPALIDMVYEDGRWVIDNFYNMKYMLDVRNCMLEYLAKDMM